MPYVNIIVNNTTALSSLENFSSPFVKLFSVISSMKIFQSEVLWKGWKNKFIA